MRPIEHFEVPHLALLKSAVSRVLAEHQGDASNGAGFDSDHPLMVGTDLYCHAFETNTEIPEPAEDKGDDPEVQAYLAQMHHRRVHAHITGDTALEATLAAQTARFKFGNPLWQQMFVQYYKYYWQYPWHEGRQPVYRSWRDETGGKGDLAYGTIAWRLPAKARVAIVGDIGTGTDEAAAVLLSALSFHPDAILHLGDVYFSGTEHEVQDRFVAMVRDVMQKSGQHLPFFTVPGNHEYFTGGTALLKALDSGDLVATPEQQQHASYFCLRTEDDGWQFLGLDTGYYGHYMNVAGGAAAATLEKLHLGPVQTPVHDNPHWPRKRNPYFGNGNPDLPQEDTSVPAAQVSVRSDEAEWHNDKLANFPGRAVLLSHHQLYSALDVCGVAQKTAAGATTPDPTDPNRIWVNTALWRLFGPAFGDKVAAWLWGHEHNLNIFQCNYRPANWPAGTPEMDTVFKTLPKGRCAGHSAIPVAEGEAPYAVKYPVPQEPPGITLGLTDGWYNHGFELMELNGRGNPARLRYYQVAGVDPTPRLLFEEDVH